MNPRGWLSLAFLVLVLVTFLLPPSVAQASSTEAALVRGYITNSSSTWNAHDFGWFYYDLDKDDGGEQLSVDVHERTAEQGHIVYSSHVWSSDFEFKPCGKYQSVAFLGKRYFAGYPDSSFTDAKSALEKGELREILIDDKNTHILDYHNPLSLVGGYILVVNEISTNDSKVNFVLVKGKTLVDMGVVSIGGTYAFKNKDDLPLILIHVSNALGGDKNGTVEVDGVFQLSDAPVVSMKEGDKLGNMDLVDLNDQEIVFKSDKDLSMTRDTVVPLADRLMIIVVNDTNLFYYPVGAITDYGNQAIRGPVFNADSVVPVRLGQYPSKAQARWNSGNFTGFYFSPEDKLGSETLTLFPPNDRTVPTPTKPEIINGEARWNGLQYVSFMQPKKFNFIPWGNYYTMSFIGEPWFVGYNLGPDKEGGESLNLLEHQKLGKVLIDQEMRGMIVAGNYSLAEGYELYIRDVTEDKIFVHLLKNGQLVDSSIAESNSTYVYKKDIGDVKDLPIIMMHVDRIFSDGKTKFASIDGLFQLSDQYLLSVEPGLGLGNMEIVGTPEFGILSMWNHDSFTLSRNSNVNLWPGLSIRVADNDTLRYYPYTVQHVVPKPVLEGIGYPKNINSSGQANFTMTALAGDIVSVNANINDPSGRTMFTKDLTRLGVGSDNLWNYFWQWNASVLTLSDDGSQILDANGNPIPGMLYLNETSRPIPVGIRFDGSGKIASIADNKVIYYVSRSDYNLTKPKSTYDYMLTNSTAKWEYIKITIGSSILKFYETVNGSFNLSKSNHTITGSIDSLEPHALRVAAKPGKYELSVRIENTADALIVNGLFFNVTAPEMHGVFLGSNSTRTGGQVSVLLEVPASDSEKKIEISYNPEVIKAIGAFGPCPTPSYMDEKAGWINVTFPPRCGMTNLTFVAAQKNATSDLLVVKLEGFKPNKVTNGSITVIAEKNTNKSNDLLFVSALAALSMAAVIRRRRMV
jgi:S-layer protein (TIGR01567 family)